MVTSFWQWNPYFWIKKFSRTSLVYLSRQSFIWHFSGQGSFKFVFLMPIWRHCEHLDHTCMGWRRIFIHLWKQKSQGRSGIISIPKTLPSLGSIKSQNIRSNWRPSYECKGFFFLFVLIGDTSQLYHNTVVPFWLVNTELLFRYISIENQLNIFIWYFGLSDVDVYQV